MKGHHDATDRREAKRPGSTDLLPERLLERLARSTDLEPFGRLVEPVAARDREKGSDLVRTLRVYFAVGANASAAADQLFLHRNSMLYRLSRVEELTGLDLKDPRAGLALRLGLLFLDEERRRLEDANQHS
jgi:DNA-binding PucR family transcriptional regulator